jgi:hypothetical protein
MAILEAAAQRPGDEINEEWEWLLGQLQLSEEYFLAVLETIRQERWRTAKNPRAYVKTVARREARKMGLLSEPTDILELVNSRAGAKDFSMEGELDRFAHASDTSEAIKGEDGVWRRGGGWGDNDDYDDEDNEPGASVSFRDLVSNGLTEIRRPSPELVAAIEEINNGTDEVHIHLQSHLRPNWEKWAEQAGFDEWDRVVLKCRFTTVSRDRALAEQPDEASRKALQAAWRRFDRNGVERLRGAIQKNLPGSVPELRLSDTR